jgi:hypothetical protein
VEFEMGLVKPSSISWLSPAPGFRYEGGDPGSNTWVYEASDLRPKHNPKMWFYTHDWSELELASWEPPERQAVLDRQAGYAAVDLHREDARWLLDFHAAIVQKACSHEDYLSKGDLATLARYAASFLPEEAIMQSAPEVRLIDAQPGEHAGQWVLEAEVIDRDSDLVRAEFRLVSAGSPDGRPIVASEDLNEWANPWARRSFRRIVDLALDRDYRFEVTAEDTAGHTVTQPLVFGTTTGPRTRSEPKGPGMPLFAAGTVAAAAGLPVAAWLWSLIRRRRRT